MIIDFNDKSTIPRQRTVVYARGIFDLFHSGHVEYIQNAANYGDVLVVGVISDIDARASKGPGRPIRSERERALVVDAIKGVDYTFVTPDPLNEKSSTEIVFEMFKPDVFVQYAEDSGRTEHYRKLAEKHGVKFIIDKSDKRLSTTSMVALIKR